MIGDVRRAFGEVYALRQAVHLADVDLVVVSQVSEDLLTMARRPCLN